MGFRADKTLGAGPHIGPWAWVVGAVLILVSTNAPLAGDSPSPQQAPSFTMEGKITQVGPGKLTVNTEENILFHVRYDDKTEIKRADGSAGSAKDLQVGTWVHVAGELSESGEIIAAKIELQERAPKKQ
jgi:Domain of unknown function (DUF5666)